MLSSKLLRLGFDLRRHIKLADLEETSGER